MYLASWAASGRAPETLPLMGAVRHLVVADSTAAAEAVAERAYRRWKDSMRHLKAAAGERWWG